jgi:integrase
VPQQQKLSFKRKKRTVDRSLLHGEAYDNFKAGIKNDRTRDPYERRLIAFLQDIHMTPDQFVSLGIQNHKDVEKILFDYIKKQVERSKQGEISPNTIRNPIKAIKLLLEMNDVVNINWKKLKKLLPTCRDYALDRIPTLDELKEIYDSADIRGKALTLTLLSSGIREGAIEALKVADWSPIRRNNKLVAGKIIVYNGEAERYTTFITAECYTAIEKYLEFRRDNGELLGHISPLFRDKFDPVNGFANEKVEPITAHSIRQYYNRLLHSIGIRKDTKRRHEFSVHGFRKWFKTRCELGGMKSLNVEILLSHSTGVTNSYYRPTESEILDEYLAVAHHLTFNDAVVLRRENEQEIQQLRRTVAIIQKDQEQVRMLLQSHRFKKALLEKG